jgi:drug/metabolite transporter (DMT)-like permease
VLDWLVYGGPRPTLLVTGGIAVGLIGILILVGAESVSARPGNLGAVAALLAACAAWALGSLYSRRAGLPEPRWLATGLQMLVAGAALLVVAAARGEWHTFDAARVHWPSLVALGYLVVFGSIVALTAYVWLLHVSTPRRVSTYAYVNPVIAIALGTILGNEPLTLRLMIGSVVIIAAVLAISRRPRSAGK